MRKSSVVEVLFMLILFTIFVMGSFFVLLLGARSYEAMSDEQKNLEELRLAQSFISNKLLQTKNSEAVTIKEIDDFKALVISEEIEDIEYTTFIYYKDGLIYECFVKGEKFKIENSKIITEIKNLDFTKENNSYFFKLNNFANQEHSFMINLR